MTSISKKESLKSLIAQRPALVEFYAPWCGCSPERGCRGVTAPRTVWQIAGSFSGWLAPAHCQAAAAVDRRLRSYPTSARPVPCLQVRPLQVAEARVGACGHCAEGHPGCGSGGCRRKPRPGPRGGWASKEHPLPLPHVSRRAPLAGPLCSAAACHRISCANTTHAPVTWRCLRTAHASPCSPAPSLCCPPLVCPSVPPLQFGVRGFPTIKFLWASPSGDIQSADYNGGRTAQEIAEW